MATDKKTIESYNKYAKNWAKDLRAGKNKSHEFLEKPAMYKKLPNLSNKIVLCIGCGTGEECEYLLSSGAKKVIGVDLSPGLIEYAKKSYPDIEFHVMDMEKLKFKDSSFDYIYSSLTMHYVEDWKKPLKEAHRVLKNGGGSPFLYTSPCTLGI